MDFLWISKISVTYFSSLFSAFSVDIYYNKCEALVILGVHDLRYMLSIVSKKQNISNLYFCDIWRTFCQKMTPFKWPKGVWIQCIMWGVKRNSCMIIACWPSNQYREFTSSFIYPSECGLHVGNLKTLHLEQLGTKTAMLLNWNPGKYVELRFIWGLLSSTVLSIQEDEDIIKWSQDSANHWRFVFSKC